MGLVSSSLQVQANWNITKTNTPFDSVTHNSSLAKTLTGDVTTPIATFAYVTSFAIANTGAGATTLDLFGSLTDLAGNTTSGKTKLIGLLFTTSGLAASASLRIAPGASNPLSMGLTGTTPKLTVPAGGFIALGWTNDGPLTIDNTHKTIDVDNPGSTSITINVYALLG